MSLVIRPYTTKAPHTYHRKVPFFPHLHILLPSGDDGKMGYIAVSFSAPLLLS